MKRRFLIKVYPDIVTHSEAEYDSFPIQEGDIEVFFKGQKLKLGEWQEVDYHANERLIRKASSCTLVGSIGLCAACGCAPGIIECTIGCLKRFCAGCLHIWWCETNDDDHPIDYGAECDACLVAAHERYGKYVATLRESGKLQ